MKSNTLSNQISHPNSEKPPEKIDVRAIMARIRTEAIAALEQHKSHIAQYSPLTTQVAENSPTPVLYSDELNYLNKHWDNWAEMPVLESHRPILGRLILAIKYRIRNLFTESLFKRYFAREKEFQLSLIRFLNATASYIDARDKEVFWQLVKKIDSDTTALSQRGDRLYDELLSELLSREKEINATMLTHIKMLEERIASLEIKVFKLD